MSGMSVDLASKIQDSQATNYNDIVRHLCATNNVDYQQNGKDRPFIFHLGDLLARENGGASHYQKGQDVLISESWEKEFNIIYEKYRKDKQSVQAESQHDLHILQETASNQKRDVVISKPKTTLPENRTLSAIERKAPVKPVKIGSRTFTFVQMLPGMTLDGLYYNIIRNPESAQYSYFRDGFSMLRPDDFNNLAANPENLVKAYMWVYVVSDKEKREIQSDDFIKQIAQQVSEKVFRLTRIRVPVSLLFSIARTETHETFLPFRQEFRNGTPDTWWASYSPWHVLGDTARRLGYNGDPYGLMDPLTGGTYAALLLTKIIEERDRRKKIKRSPEELIRVTQEYLLGWERNRDDIVSFYNGADKGTEQHMRYCERLMGYRDSFYEVPRKPETQIATKLPNARNRKS